MHYDTPLHGMCMYSATTATAVPTSKQYLASLSNCTELLTTMRGALGLVRH